VLLAGSNVLPGDGGQPGAIAERSSAQLAEVAQRLLTAPRHQRGKPVSLVVSDLQIP
jgi:hypothetical protein